MFRHYIRSFLPLALSLFAFTWQPVKAQQTTAVCSDDLEFMDNTKGQNPCVVLSTLFGACTNNVGNFNLEALAPEFSGYAGATSTDAGSFTYNQCLCSMPVYNLISACETCQSKTVISFAAFTQTCNSSFTGSDDFPSLKVPVPVPDSTVLPPWSFIDNTGSTWTTSQVLSAIGQDPNESVSEATQSGTVQIGGTSVPVATSLADSDDKDNTSVGAIVGGVIGGIALACLVALLAYLILRQKSVLSLLPKRMKRGGNDQYPGLIPTMSQTEKLEINQFQPTITQWTVASVEKDRYTPATSLSGYSTEGSQRLYKSGFGSFGGGFGQSQVSYSGNMNETASWESGGLKGVEQFGGLATMPAMYYGGGYGAGAGGNYNGLAEVQDETRKSRMF